MDNYCVIMGGGIGSRFWPFSRKTLPKQFLDFFGTGRSLLQQTFDRFQKVIPTENILIVTNAMYADLVKEQLPELDEKQILLEPARRNTAPCIAWAAYHIRALNPNANIVVAPSDHLILKEEEFRAAIIKGLEFVSHSEKLLTLGIKPNRPETGYGYIQIDEPTSDGFYKVKTFTEKPELELAKVFVESGEFYWNSGLFMWNVNTIIKAAEILLPELASKLAPGKNIYATDKEKAFIEENFPNDFCLSGGCYPETHYEAKNFEEDLLNLKKKVDAGAKYLVTQIFYDNQYYYRLVREARKIGIHIPILAGIMPAHNPKQLKNIAKMSNCSVPFDLAAMIDRFAGNPKAGREVGLHYATYQIIDLMTHGVDGIHIYTMNKPEIAKEILKRTEYIRDEFFKD